MTSVGRSTALGVALVTLGIVIAACAARPPAAPEWQRRQQRMNELTTLWVQIRDWRREARMDLDPSPSSMMQWRGRGTVPEAARACPDNHQVPRSCDEVCNLADAICDNAEAICGIADELGKDDAPAQEKCVSSKASCREAKQRCCACSDTEVAP